MTAAWCVHLNSNKLKKKKEEAEKEKRSKGFKKRWKRHWKLKCTSQSSTREKKKKELVQAYQYYLHGGE